VIVRQLLTDKRDDRTLLMLVQRATSELLESHNGGESWTTLPLTAVEHAKPAALSVDQIQQAFASPWGWLVRLGDGRFWLWRDEKGSWDEWKLMSSTPAATRMAKSARRALKADGPIAFSDNEAVVATNEGVMRCRESGLCARGKAFVRITNIHSLWISHTGKELALVEDNKLGRSSDAGTTAVWRDLPVPQNEIAWLDVAEPSPEEDIFLGTSKGLFRSQRGTDSWQRVEKGLPPGHAEAWLLSSRIWALSEQDGGLYVSRDRGANWNRVDRDSERGRFTGLVATPTGGLLAGSQSEGLLRLETASQP